MSETTGAPKQLLILQKITALLQAITPANGYAYDLSTSVFRGRTWYGDDEPLPAVSILENPRPGIALEADEWNSTRKTSWELLVQGWAVDDKTNPLDPVYPLKASVEMQLAQVVATIPGFGKGKYPNNFLLGGLIVAMRIGPGVCRPPDKNLSSRAFFYLPVGIDYMETLPTPFV